MNAIFCAITLDEYKRILTCTEAKEAWEILEMTHEGTSHVKSSKLQMLKHQFETMKMEEDETIQEYHTRLNDVVTTSWGFGVPYSDTEIIYKILRSLTDKW